MPSKSDSIRAYLEQHPEAKPKEIAEALTAQLGKLVSPGLVSTTKSSWKRKQEALMANLVPIGPPHPLNSPDEEADEIAEVLSESTTEEHGTARPSPSALVPKSALGKRLLGRLEHSHYRRLSVAAKFIADVGGIDDAKELIDHCDQIGAACQGHGWEIMSE